MNYFIKKTLFLFVILCSFSACTSSKNNFGSSGNKLYETFYVGEEGVQYFIKPSSLQSIDSDDFVLIDFTFRNKENQNSNVTVNFSLISSKVISNIENFNLNKQAQTATDNKGLSLLFKEAVKKGFMYRYTAKVPFQEIKEFISKEESLLTLTIDAKDYTFARTKKTDKAFKKMTRELMVFL